MYLERFSSVLPDPVRRDQFGDPIYDFKTLSRKLAQTTSKTLRFPFTNSTFVLIAEQDRRARY